MSEKVKLSDLPIFSKLNLDFSGTASSPENVVVTLEDIERAASVVEVEAEAITESLGVSLTDELPGDFNIESPGGQKSIAPVKTVPGIELNVLKEAYLRAAALRYLYCFDYLTPFVDENASQTPVEELKYWELPAGWRDEVFAFLTERSLIVGGSGNEYQWMLKDEERQPVLQRLVAAPSLLNNAVNLARADAEREAQERRQPNEAAAEDSGDEGLEQLFWGYLQGENYLLAQQDRRKLILIQRIIKWLPTGLNIPSVEAVAEALTRATFLQPFRHLTGEWKDGEFHSYFIGREDELSVLYEYLAVRKPKTMAQYLGRIISRISSFASQILSSNNRHLPILIYGPGGIGKSTLLAKFLLEHLTENEPPERFPFAYLDFDLSVLDSREPLSLLAEMARQFAVQYSSSRESWNDLRSKCLESCRDKSREISPQQRNLYLNELVELLENSEQNGVKVSDQFKEDLPLLVVFDTFEEVQYRNRDGVKDIFRFINQLQLKIPNSKLILMGRASLGDVRDEFGDLEALLIEGDFFGSGMATNFAVTEVELNELSTEDTRRYLIARGVTDPSFLDEIVVVIGGNPLILRLITQLIEKNNLEISSLREEINWRPSLTQRLLGRSIPPKEVLQGVLFRRILGHIHDPEIEALAHPGLLLRRITPDIIREVLAGPCKLDEITVEKAKELFDGLAREVSLVRTETDENGETVLFHRPELRKIMIKLIDADENKQFEIKQVHENAVRYYQIRPGTEARTEEYYHRLAINELPPTGLLDEVPTEEAIFAGFVPPSSENEELREAWRRLANALDELPLTARTYLDARLNSELSKDEDWENANPADRELVTLCRVSRRARERDNISHSYNTLSREIYQLYSTMPDDPWSPLWLIDVTLLERIKNFVEALKKIDDRCSKIDSSLSGGISDADKYKRLLQYNMLGLRISANVLDDNISVSSFQKYLSFIADRAEYSFSQIKPDLLPRIKRQILRFTADSILSLSAFKVLPVDLSDLPNVPKLDSILLNSGLESFDNCQMLVGHSFCARKIFKTDFPFQELLQKPSAADVFSSLINALKMSSGKISFDKLDDWLNKVISENPKKQAVAEFLELNPTTFVEWMFEREKVARGMEKIFKLPPPQVGGKLKKLFVDGSFTNAEINEFFNVLLEKLDYTDLQASAFEEARRLGDLLPGEGMTPERLKK